MTKEKEFFSTDRFGEPVGVGDLVSSSYNTGTRRELVKGIVVRLNNAGSMYLDVPVNARSTPYDANIASSKRYDSAYTTLIAHASQIPSYNQSMEIWKHENLSKEGA